MHEDFRYAADSFFYKAVIGNYEYIIEYIVQLDGVEIKGKG